MRVLVLSDVHANLAALEAVLADAPDHDALWSLGDIVGYGPDPNECVALLRERDHVAIPGNHDWGVLGKLDLEYFNAAARDANLWSRQVLDAESRQYLEALPEKQVLQGVTLAHGSPRDPLWEYLLSHQAAKISFSYFGTDLCLVGHTHVPMIFRDESGAYDCQAIYPPTDRVIRLDRQRYIINPGSVGQPRDHDPRAAYMLLDTEAWTVMFRRVEYDVARTQERMRAAKLPRRLWMRLASGW